MVTCIYTYLYIFLYVAISTWFASSLRQRWVHADASNSDSLLHGTFSSCMSVTSNSQKLLSHKPPTIYLIVQFQYTCGAVSQSVRLHRCVWLFATPWAAVCQSSLSITNFRSLLKLLSIELVMPSNYLILGHPLLLLPSIFPSISIFSCCREKASSDPKLELFLWLAFRCFCCYNHTKWFASENSAPLLDY